MKPFVLALSLSLILIPFSASHSAAPIKGSSSIWSNPVVLVMSGVAAAGIGTAVWLYYQKVQADKKSEQPAVRPTAIPARPAVAPADASSSLDQEILAAIQKHNRTHTQLTALRDQLRTLQLDNTVVAPAAPLSTLAGSGAGLRAIVAYMVANPEVMEDLSIPATTMPAFKGAFPTMTAQILVEGRAAAGNAVANHANTDIDGAMMRGSLIRFLSKQPPAFFYDALENTPAALKPGSLEKAEANMTGLKRNGQFSVFKLLTNPNKVELNMANDPACPACGHQD